MDEALKRGESLQSKKTEITSETVHQPSQYADYSGTESSEAVMTAWNSYNYYEGYDNYDNSQAWDYSQYYQTDKSCSTQDPYREMLASNNETNAEEASTS